MAAKQRSAGMGVAHSNELAREFRTAVGHHRAGRFDEAEKLYHKIIDRHPEQPDALNFLGVLASQRGTHEKAIDFLRRAITVNRRKPTYHYNLGLAYQAAGNLIEAVASYRRVLELEPNNAAALKGLGGALLVTNRLEEAETCCRKVTRLLPEDPRAHNNLSAVLLGRNHLHDAEASAREALRLMPNYAEAFNNLGNVLLAREDYEEAAECYRKTLRLLPGYPEAHHNLGIALRGLAEHLEAAASIREAIKIKPDYAEAHNSLASTYRALGYGPDALYEYRQALRYKPDYDIARVGLANVLIDRGDWDASLARFQEILDQNPNSEQALVGKAGILERKGLIEESFAIIRPIVDGGSPSPDVAGVFSGLARQFGREGEAIALLEDALASSELKSDQRSNLSFILGKLYDANGEFDLAFQHYSVGNELQPTKFDPKMFAAWLDKVIEFYNNKRVRRMPRAANESVSPVFIVGIPRSGTSLTEQIVASHTKVYGAGELDDIPRIVRDVAGGPGSEQRFPDCVADLDSAALDVIAEKHIQQLREYDEKAEIFTDKMPYNFMYLGLIAQLFPRARVIHCVRDPLDTCLSCFFQNFARGNFQTYRLGHLGAYHVEYQRLMRHWHDVLDIPIKDIVYEDLVADLEGKSRELVDFVGLEWDPQCLRFHESKRLVNTASYDQVRQPIYNRSVGRWRHYDRHLGPLKEALAGAS